MPRRVNDRSWLGCPFQVEAVKDLYSTDWHPQPGGNRVTGAQAQLSAAMCGKLPTLGRAFTGLADKPIAPDDDPQLAEQQLRALLVVAASACRVSSFHGERVSALTDVLLLQVGCCPPWGEGREGLGRLRLTDGGIATFQQ